MLCALIMAGGKGERFWPLSTDEKPKQFLKLISDDTMIQMTVKRLLTIIPIERIFIVTGKRYESLVREQLPELPQRNIIIEPIGRNTAPCIALSAFYINKYYNDATLIVLPSDHQIQDNEQFIKILKTGSDFIQKNRNAIVTIGMKPNRPETGYGYIKYDGRVTSEILKDPKVFKVEKFVEKPDKITAENYVKDGRYLWNGGIFIWGVSNILNLTKLFLRNTYMALSEIASARDEEYNSTLLQKYPNVDNISVDFAIMEKAKEIYVVPGDFGWDDVGTWYSLERYRRKDKYDNICIGDIESINSYNNLIFSSGKQIVLVDMNDMFVVESNDMILIGRKKDIENIKEIKQKFN